MNIIATVHVIKLVKEEQMLFIAHKSEAPNLSLFHQNIKANPILKI